MQYHQFKKIKEKKKLKKWKNNFKQQLKLDIERVRQTKQMFKKE